MTTKIDALIGLACEWSVQGSRRCGLSQLVLESPRCIFGVVLNAEGTGINGGGNAVAYPWHSASFSCLEGSCSS